MRSVGAIWRLFENSRARSSAVALSLGVAVAFFLQQVNRHYPIADWLFWHYAGYWAAVALWALAVWGLGLTLLERVFKLSLPFYERLLIAFTLGQLAFDWLLFLVGAVQGYRAFAFLLVPAAAIGASFRALGKLFRQARRVFALHTPARSLARLAIIGFGFIGLLMVYFLVLTPENVQFDARWKHMALAEDYVAHGGIRRSGEGWMFAARPHLVSYLYAWAFLFPSPRLFDKMLMAAHLEYFTFVVTSVLGVSALVRRLVPRADPSMVWVARFLFPGVLLYDSSVSGGTDHFGAAFAPALALALFGALRALEVRRVALLAALLAGPILVKETAALLLVPFPLLALGTRFCLDAVRGVRRSDPLARRKLWLVPLVGIGVGLAATAPLWLQNLVFYGDPLYPSLSRFFPSHPFSAAAAYKFKWFYSERQMWAPPRTLDGLLLTLKTLFSYSFEPNDWKSLHRDVPVFGSLFTLLLLALPFLQKTRKIWLIVAWVHCGIFAWYMVHHQDRYLQGIVPLMAASVAATLVLIFRSTDLLARAVASVLVLAQIVWGGDVYFIQTHSMAKSPIKKVVDLLSAGFNRDYEDRFRVSGSLAGMQKFLPQNARVLFHEQHPHLGVGRESVLDNYPWQNGIDYGAQGSPEGVRAMLRALGITHVNYAPGRSNAVASLASDLLFQVFVSDVGSDAVHAGSGILVKVPDAPTGVPFNDLVCVLTCRQTPNPGLYPLKSLDRFEYGPDGEKFGPPLESAADAERASAYLADAGFAVVDPHCFHNRLPAELTKSFERLLRRRRDPREIWRRSSERSPAEPTPARATPREKEAPAESNDGVVDPSESPE